MSESVFIISDNIAISLISANNIKGPTVTSACLNGSSVNVEWIVV